MANRFHLLKCGLVMSLILVGVKMLIADFCQVHMGLAPGGVGRVIATRIAASRLANRKRRLRRRNDEARLRAASEAGRIGSRVGGFLIMTIDPVVLFFLLGLTAGLLRSDLRLPAAIYDFLIVILLLGIGLKGGVELSRQSLGTLAPQMLAVVLMGLALPLIAYPLLRYAVRLKRPDAASIAAHYGSVSVGTYAVVAAYLVSQRIAFEEYMPLFVVLLEVPAILVGIVLARGITRSTRWGSLAHEVFLGKGVVLLTGGLVIGWIAGIEGVQPIEGLFFDLFKGVLALFLLEMGLIVAGQMSDIRRHGLFLIVFSIAFPLFAACIGAGLGWLLDLSLGGTVVLATLAASASYIAVPAAMRMAVPEANPALSLAASLGVTFPFNIVVGIPLYHALARQLYGAGG